MDTKAAFEKWLTDGLDQNGLTAFMLIQKRESGSYQIDHVNGKWEAWQASRAAIEISPVEEYSDSPLDIIYEQPDNLSRDEVTQFGYMRGYNDCLNELSTSHGIKIKGESE